MHLGTVYLAAIFSTLDRKELIWAQRGCVSGEPIERNDSG
jgi:hypothetical protein